MFFHIPKNKTAKKVKVLTFKKKPREISPNRTNTHKLLPIIHQTKQ
jgi:hypothetical protein